MLQKTQWTMAATALAIGVCLATAARPAQAQVRIHLTRGGVKTTTGSGIVVPNASSPTAPATGIVIPNAFSSTTPATGIVIPNTAPTTPPPANPSTPAPTPVVRPSVAPVIPVQTVSASQGFSVGPSLLGDQRLPLGRLVDRVPPAIIGDSGPTVQKVVAHH
jgi:hypothetical protein